MIQDTHNSKMTIILHACSHQHSKLPFVCFGPRWSHQLPLEGCFKIKTFTPAQRSCQAHSLCLSTSCSAQKVRWQRNKQRFCSAARWDNDTNTAKVLKGLTPTEASTEMFAVMVLKGALDKSLQQMILCSAQQSAERGQTSPLGGKRNTRSRAKKF